MASAFDVSVTLFVAISPTSAPPVARLEPGATAARAESVTRFSASDPATPTPVPPAPEVAWAPKASVPGFVAPTLIDFAPKLTAPPT